MNDNLQPKQDDMQIWLQVALGESVGQHLLTLLTALLPYEQTGTTPEFRTAVATLRQHLFQVCNTDVLTLVDAGRLALLAATPSGSPSSLQ